MRRGKLAAALVTIMAVTGCASSVKVDHPAAASSRPSTTTTPAGPTTDIFDIPSGAMEPTLQPGDKVHVNYHLPSLARGYIVVFHKPPSEDAPGIIYLIKRIVGMPGETISAGGGVVDIDGKPLKEPWLPRGVMTGEFSPVSIRAGDYFVMGDNRSNSADSRIFGPISGDLIIGVADQIVYPPNRVGSILPESG